MTVMRMDCSKPAYRVRGTSYQKIWNLLDSPIFHVVDQDGNELQGRVRHLLGRYWMYANQFERYQILSRQEVEELCLSKQPSAALTAK